MRYVLRHRVLNQHYYAGATLTIMPNNEEALVTNWTDDIAKALVYTREGLEVFHSTSSELLKHVMSNTDPVAL